MSVECVGEGHQAGVKPRVTFATPPRKNPQRTHDIIREGVPARPARPVLFTDGADHLCCWTPACPQNRRMPYARQVGRRYWFTGTI